MISDHIKIGKTEDYLLEYLSDKKYSKIAFLVDKNTKENCLNKFKDSLKFSYEIIKIEVGEEHKNLTTCSKVWESLTNLNFDRNSLIINLGGGVICDLGGFIAATYKRGIDFINIPTTLLSQVDASIGGKLGIDFNNYKNHIGVFEEPNTIIIDTKFLSTLSKRELKSGFAEIIKHCLIKDSSKFDEISNNLDWGKNNWNDLVYHSIDIKLQVVKLDLKEGGIRKILNYGHTLGHAIETTYMSKKNKLLHGEAISIGMICEAYISFYFNKLTKDELNKISNFINQIYNLQKIDYFEEIIKHTFQDKKNVNQKIRTCVLNGIGDCEYDIEINPDLILDSLEYYNKIL